MSYTTILVGALLFSDKKMGEVVTVVDRTHSVDPAPHDWIFCDNLQNVRDLS